MLENVKSVLFKQSAGSASGRQFNTLALAGIGVAVLFIAYSITNGGRDMQESEVLTLPVGAMGVAQPANSKSLKKTK